MTTEAEKPKQLRKPKFTKVNKVEPDSKGLNLYLKVLSCQVVHEEDRDGSPLKLGEARAGDDSGVVTLRVRDAQIETCKEGSSIVVQNGHVKMFRGFIRVEVDKWGKLRAAEGAHAFTVKESVDVSATEYELAGKEDRGGAKKKKFDAAAALHNTPKTHDGAVKLYDDWADSYDDSLTQWGYEAPEKVAEYLWENLKAAAATDAAVRIMDCGCGTGMSGQALVSGAIKKNPSMKTEIVGTDCSPESLKLCLKKKLRLNGAKPRTIYQKTAVVNLEKKQEEFADNSFDGVTCVGTTSYLHDFDMVFGEWCRMCKKGAVIVFTHRTNIWDENDNNVQTSAKKMEETGKWKLLSRSDKRPYMPKNPVAEEAAKTIYYNVYEVL